MIGRMQWQRAAALADAHGHDWAGWAQTNCDEVSAWYTETCPAAQRVRGVGEIAAGMAPRGHDAVMCSCGSVRPSARLRPPPASWEAARAQWLEARAEERGILGRPPSPSHVTGTGRLSWVVGGDGTVRLDVHRPDIAARRIALERALAAGGAWVDGSQSIIVLTATVRPSGRVELREWRRRRDADGRLVQAEDRHWHALARAVCAVSSDEAWENARDELARREEQAEADARYRKQRAAILERLGRRP
jgi:hypothetical protein